MSPLSRRPLAELVAQWTQLPPINARIPSGKPYTSSLLEKVAVVLGERVSDHPSGVSPLLVAYTRELEALVTLPVLGQLGDPLSAHRAQLEALGPRLAAYGRPNRALEQRGLLLCIRLALRLASSWLASSDLRSVAEHTAKLQALAEAEYLDYARAAQAAKEACWATRKASGEVAQAFWATEEAHAAYQAMQQSGEGWVQRWSAYLAPAWNPHRAAEAATNSAYWAATCASWARKAKAKASKANEGARRTVEVSRRAVLWRVDLLTEIPPSLRTQIQMDADFLLTTLQTMLDLWEGSS